MKIPVYLIHSTNTQRMPAVYPALFLMVGFDVDREDMVLTLR